MANSKSKSKGYVDNKTKFHKVDWNKTSDEGLILYGTKHKKSIEKQVKKK